MRAMLAMLALAALVRAEPGLDDALSKVRTSGPAERDAAVRAVLALDPDPGVVRAKLIAGVASGSLPAGWHVRESVDAKGVKRPYQLYLPKSVAGTTGKVPLLVHMHGGVSRDAFLTEKGQVGSGRMFWPDFAEEERFVVLFPMGMKGCTWLDDVGVKHVRDCIRDVKRFAPIDDNAIVGTGFSDGGSGCYYFAMVGHEPFAALMPMNGHPAVGASVSGNQLYVRNMMGMPLFVAMTQDDQLYPGYSVLPHLTPLVKANAPLHLVSYPTGGHTPSYFEDLGETFVNYLISAQRDTQATELDWWCATPAHGRHRWVEILDVGPAEGEAEAMPDLNVMSTPGRVMIGIRVVPTFEGPGVKVESVSEGTPAESVGMAAGDVIVDLDGTAIEGLDDLRAVLGAKKFGDRFEVTWKRGETRTTANGRFPGFESRPIYRRDAPTARISVRVEGQNVEVSTRNVRRFRLLLSPEMFADKPLTLRVNGGEVASKTVRIPLETLLRRYAADADSGRLFTRELVAELPRVHLSDQ